MPKQQQSLKTIEKVLPGKNIANQLHNFPFNIVLLSRAKDATKNLLSCENRKSFSVSNSFLMNSFIICKYVFFSGRQET